jgi:hypothetical protein
MTFAIIGLYDTIEFNETCMFERYFRAQMVRVTSKIIEFIHVDAGKFIRHDLQRYVISLFR